MQILQKMEDKLEACRTRTEKLKDRIMFMSMFNDTGWVRQTIYKIFFEFRKGQELRKKFSAWTWSSLGPGKEDTWYGTHNLKAEGQWNISADVMVENFKESGHPLNR